MKSLCLLALALTTAASAEEYTLPPIIKDASPVDVLDRDPVVPAKGASVEPANGSGSVVRNLQEQLPYSVTDIGRPGGLSQFRGLGVSADDTSVQALGIPLNYPQGGGFDFSTFPQFFWNAFRFQESPSVSGLDLRGVSGTVSLDPWTADALNKKQVSTRWTALYSDSDLVQLSLAAKPTDRVAVLAGTSSGQINGPSGSVSAIALENGNTQLRFHLLATDVEQDLYNFGGSKPNENRVVRMIPVGELDFTPATDWTVRNNLFYDNVYIRADDYSNSYFTRDRAQQIGTENSIVYQDWKLGAGARHVSYQLSGNFVPDETVTHAALSKTASVATGEGSRLIAQPVVEEVSQSGYGAYPIGSFGLREELGDGDFALFARGTYSRRFPSLADRYYSAAGAAANPNLQPEKDLTGILGTEAHGRDWSALVQGYYQVRDSAQATVTLSDGFTSQVQNVGQARIASLLVEGTVQPARIVMFSDSFTWNDSHSDALKGRFPLLPNLINISRLSMYPARSWTVDLIGRVQSNASTGSSATTLPSAAFGDFQLTYDWTKSLSLIGKVENFTGESLILYPGYPPKGRVISIAAVGAL